MLLVITIPYLLFGFFIEMFNSHGFRMLKLRKILYGKRAISLILLIITSFWILRNIIEI